MSDQSELQAVKSPAPGRGYLLASLACAIAFAANVVYGKIAISQGATTTPGFGDVGEFLVLFVTVAFFIAACVSRERAKAKSEPSK